MSLATRLRQPVGEAVLPFLVARAIVLGALGLAHFAVDRLHPTGPGAGAGAGASATGAGASATGAGAIRTTAPATATGPSPSISTASSGPASSTRPKTSGIRASNDHLIR